MTQSKKLQHIKLFIKTLIIVCVFGIFVILGFFVKPIRTFENANMKKWLNLSEQEQLTTLQRVVHNAEDQALLIDCVTKIAELPNSQDMIIHDAIVLCYNGIKQNQISNEN